MFKTITAILFAAVIIHASVGVPRATVMIETGPQRALKSDRLMPRSIEPACTYAAWPHYCVRSQPGTQAREVRIVAIDHLPSKNLKAPSAN